MVRAWYHTNNNYQGQNSVWNDLGSIFYADDGYLLYGRTCTETLQRATEHIVEMFTRMGLRMNANKTKAMICTPGQLYTRISSPAYQRLIGNLDGPTHSLRKKRRVICDICEVTIQIRHLARHRRDQHGIAIPQAENRTPPHLSNPGTTYLVQIPNCRDKAICPVSGCGATVTARYGMRRHFHHRHINDTTIIIEEEGPLPRCESCGMFVHPLLCIEGTRHRERDKRNLTCRSNLVAR
jgi:hypothetical protein